MSTEKGQADRTCLQRVTSKRSETATANVRESPVVRHKPNIQLPVNPQIPSNTQRLNPRYMYKKLADIKSSANTGDLRKVNLFAVVNHINKPLSKTSTGKSTIICKIVDESLKGKFDLHFFTQDDTIIKQIEEGDVIRLHRVKMEFFNNDVDGRVFNSCDIILFKKSSSYKTPVHTAKNSVLTDEEKLRVQTLAKWYEEFLSLEELNNVVLLGDISVEGVYGIVCKVVSLPVIESKSVTLTVTDGSVVEHLIQSISDSTSPSTVVELKAFKLLNQYSKLKEEDFVFLPEIEVVENNGLRLVINSCCTFRILDHTFEKVQAIERRINQLKRRRVLPTNNTEEEVCVDKVIKSDKSLPNDLQNNDKEALLCASIVTNKNKTRSPKKVPLIDLCKKTLNPKTRAKETSTAKQNEKSNIIESNAENQRGKVRKILFTANCADLSDATDEASDILDTLTQFRADPSGDEVSHIVTPADTSFVDLIEHLKNKYCSPRKIKIQKQDGSLQPTNLPDGSKREETKYGHYKMKSAVVKLVKLSEEHFKSTKNDATRKRRAEEDESKEVQEILDDADTVVNVSCQTRHVNKRIRLESESTVLGGGNETVESLVNTLDPLLAVGELNRDEKVCSWLLHPENKLAGPAEPDDLKRDADNSILSNVEQKDVDHHQYLFSINARIKVFLLGVTPDPSLESLDLVSGFCSSGCLQMFVFSSIHWLQKDDTCLPVCPSCIHLQQERHLDMMFMMELKVMDQKGQHVNLIVCNKEAIIFLNCSVENYVKDPELRKSRAELLSDYTISKTTGSSTFTPLLDISCVLYKDKLLVTNTILKSPNL